ncbi:hypothetical protein [Lacticaseibacillus saniviri]|uniref:hypothetical protein n=1 Tax=Lacticaseibacillus saniviri TaxID=931533 RepID=UPI0006D201FD|nr:hypothetical protein [Lacticaseibacillus saniviri]
MHNGQNGGIELFIKCDTAIQADAAKLAQIGMTVQQDDYHELIDYFQPSGGLAIPILRMATIEMIPRTTLQAQFDRFSVPQGYYFWTHAKNAVAIDAECTRDSSATYISMGR